MVPVQRNHVFRTCATCMTTRLRLAAGMACGRETLRIDFDSRIKLEFLMDVAEKWIDRVRQNRAWDKLILNLNSSVSQTYGRRE